MRNDSGDIRNSTRSIQTHPGTCWADLVLQQMEKPNTHHFREFDVTYLTLKPPALRFLDALAAFILIICCAVRGLALPTHIKNQRKRYEEETQTPCKTKTPNSTSPWPRGIPWLPSLAFFSFWPALVSCVPASVAWRGWHGLIAWLTVWLTMVPWPASSGLAGVKNGNKHT